MRQGLVGIDVVVSAGLGDLGADLGVELLGGEGLGILGGIDGRGGAGLAAAAMRELLEEPLDLGPESLVERVAGRGDLGEEVPGPLSMSPCGWPSRASS